MGIVAGRLSKRPKTAYPVIYVLDAENNFNYLSSVYHYLSKEPFGILPQGILVAVANTNRTRDLTPTKSSKEMDLGGKKQSMFTESGGNAAFMEFIKGELFPLIEKNYRTNGYKVFVGHSFGGLTAVNNLLTEPLFNAYIANDPSLWWDKELMVKKAEASTRDFKNIKFFWRRRIMLKQEMEKRTNTKLQSESLKTFWSKES